MKTAAIYCRVSTQDQEREGTSLQSQLEACLKYANEQSYEVSDQYVIREVYSGLTLERPGLEQLRNLVNNKEINSVVVYSTDRLSRDPVHLLFLVEECDKKEVKLHFVTEPLDNSMEGQLLGFVRGWASKLEAVKIRERTMRGKRARALSGKLPTGNPLNLYGYYYLPGKGVGEGIRYIDEDQANWVREMFRWLVEERLSTSAITYRLRDLGVPTPSGKGYWIRRSVCKILTNPAYYGKTYAFTQTHNKKTGIIWKPKEEWLEIPGATPPIISEELFEATQKQLKRNKELASRSTNNQYLLRGHIYCGRCGRSFWGGPGTKTRGGRRYGYPFYGCSGNLKAVSPIKCGNPRASASIIEPLIWDQIETILTKPELVIAEIQRRQQEGSDITTKQNRLERIEAQLANREKQKTRTWKAFEITGDETTFKASIDKLDDEIKRLQKEKEQLQKQIELSSKFVLGVEDIERACELVKRNVSGLSFEDKRLALEALQVKIWIDGDNVAIEGAIPILQENVTGPLSGLHRPALHPES